MTEKHRILIVTPEFAELPLSIGEYGKHVGEKTGGLGEIAATLYRELHGNEFDIYLAMPRFDRSIKERAGVDDRDVVRISRELRKKGIHLIEDSAFSNVPTIGGNIAIYRDDETHTKLQRATAVQRGVINYVLDQVDPDIVHCNDWMTGLVPAAARSRGISSLFTLHNTFTEYPRLLDLQNSGINADGFKGHLWFEAHPDGVENSWRNRVDLTASGIHAADFFNTVSESFLRELVGNASIPVTDAVRQAIREKHSGGRARGILNAPNGNGTKGIQLDEKNILGSKILYKEKIRSMMGLKTIEKLGHKDAPLFFFPNRLDYQKGPDLLISNAQRLVTEYKIQIVVVASGEPYFEKKFGEISIASDGMIAFQRYDEGLSKLAMVGSDFLFMISRWEPSGIPQMEGPRYGTLAVGRKTGGLNDTIYQLDLTDDIGNGFLFNDSDSGGLKYGVGEAVRFWGQPTDVRERTLRRVREESIERHNPKKTAEEYSNLYRLLIKERYQSSNRN